MKWTMESFTDTTVLSEIIKAMNWLAFMLIIKAVFIILIDNGLLP